MPVTMTKARLTQRVHDRVGISKRTAGELVDDVFELMRDALEKGEKVKVTGFGNFVVRMKAARRGRNPQTNASITIQKRRVIVFKASHVLRNALNDGN